MKLFPGTSTLAERRKFAIFHLYTLILCPVAVMLVMFFTYNGNTHNHPFEAGMEKGIFISLLVWNFFGAWRFISDSHDAEGFLFSRLIAIALIVGFPFFYLYNLWCLIRKNE